MVAAWYMDDLMDDPRLDHQLDPPRPIEMDQLFKRTGVLYWKVNLCTACSVHITPMVLNVRCVVRFGYT